MVRIEEFKGLLQVKGSGLRIGGSKDFAGVGEKDNPIIRHPITRVPYIPGSSVKGKIRSLLESKYCAHSQETGKPCNCGTCAVCQLFGKGDHLDVRSPSRVVFRDSQPTESTKQWWSDAGVDSEVKYEVRIDRKTGMAADRALRDVERIPAESAFDFSISIRTFEGDNVSELYSKLAEGFDLLEKHYLGGSGSRGYGEVAITTLDGNRFSDFLREKVQGS